MPTYRISPQRNRNSWNEIYNLTQFSIDPDIQYIFRFVMNMDDLQDPTVNIGFQSFTADSESGPWRGLAGITYIGGVYDPQDQPGLIIPSNRVRNKWIKVECTINKRLNIGFEVEW